MDDKIGRAFASHDAGGAGTTRAEKLMPLQRDEMIDMARADLR